jgi:hypothetical protein
LMEGVVSSMYVAKLKLAAVLLLTLGLLGAGGGLLGRGGSDRLHATVTPPEPTPKKDLSIPPANKVAEVAPAPAPNSPQGDLEIRDRLFAQVFKFDGIDDPKTTLQDALELISQRYGIPFDVDERAFKRDKSAPILRTEIATLPLLPQTASVSVILRKILSRLPDDARAVFLIRKGRVEITSESAARQELGIIGNLEPFPVLVYEHFEDVPLLEAIRTVGRDADVNVVIDPAAAALVKDTKISAPLHNVPAESAVFILAQMGDLGMVSYGNVLYVAPANKAENIEMRRHGQEPTPSTDSKSKSK